VGEDTDIVSKEMYTFEDRDGSKSTSRPEATASVMRAHIEHRLDQEPGLKKSYYIGPMFRRERPQKGRYRQFFQIGAEAIGSDSPSIDAEVIEMRRQHHDLLGELGVAARQHPGDIAAAHRLERRLQRHRHADAERLRAEDGLAVGRAFGDLAPRRRPAREQ
ncbi:hypothetical protein OY671_011537, partial [Metschnikowia pulcherrima]